MTTKRPIVKGEAGWKAQRGIVDRQFDVWNNTVWIGTYEVTTYKEKTVDFELRCRGEGGRTYRPPAALLLELAQKVGLVELGATILKRYTIGDLERIPALVRDASDSHRTREEQWTAVEEIGRIARETLAAWEKQ